MTHTTVYLVFYARCNNPYARCLWYRPIDSLLDWGIDVFTGPFTHCHLAYGVKKVKGKELGVSCTKFTPRLGGVLSSTFPERDKHGDCYLQLQLTDTEYRLLLKTIDTMYKGGKTYFSWGEFFGFTNPGLATEERGGWICASFFGFLCQRIGLIEREVDVNKLNVTLLYLLLRQNTRTVKQVEYYPFNLKKERIPTPDEVYMKRMEIGDPTKIPIRIFNTGAQKV